jgi:Ca2+-binding RTX toxin-like protein
MSELIVQPGAQSLPDFRLEIINNQPVRVVNSLPPAPQTAPGVVEAEGSPVADTIRALSITDPTIFVINAGGGDDIVSTAAAADSISGGDGNDVISVGGGNDVARGNAGNDQILGFDGRDFLIGSDGDDVIDGGPGDDELAGEAGNDRLSGGDGNDLLRGGGGRDLLTGGAGRDTFRFARGSTGGTDRRQADVITDFDPASDTIELQSSLKNLGFDVGRLRSSDFRVVNRISQLEADATAQIVYERRTGLVYLNRADGQNVILLQLSNRPSDLSASDFEIF